MERFSPAPSYDAQVQVLSKTAVSPCKQIIPYQDISRYKNGNSPSHETQKVAKQDQSNGTDKKASAGTLLKKIQTPYNGYEKRFQRLQKQLKVGSTEDVVVGEGEDEPVILPACPLYSTSFGTFTFIELCERTRNYTSFALLHTYHVHPADIEDGLQAAYLCLWQRLKDQPDVVSGKPFIWMCKWIIYAALHAIREDWKFQQPPAQMEMKMSSKRLQEQQKIVFVPILLKAGIRIPASTCIRRSEMYQNVSQPYRI